MKLKSFDEVVVGDLLHLYVYGELQPHVVIYLGLSPWKAWKGDTLWDRYFFDIQRCETYCQGVHSDIMIREIWLWARL